MSLDLQQSLVSVLVQYTVGSMNVGLAAQPASVVCICSGKICAHMTLSQDIVIQDRTSFVAAAN